MTRSFLFILAFGLATHWPGVASAEDAGSNLSVLAERVAGGNLAGPSGVRFAAVEFLPALYGARDDRLVWDDPANLAALLAGIEGAVGQGFRPEDFHQPTLDRLVTAAQGGGGQAQAELDIVASDAAARLIHHLIRGKVDAASLDPDWNFAQPMIDASPAAEAVSEFADGEGFAALLARIAPSAPQYLDLVDALALYRGIAATGGWPAIGEGEVLKPGMTDPRIADLRGRLAAEGVLTAPPPEAERAQVYTPELAADVRAFQTRHGLEADGVIGAKTLTALNRTAEERVDQIRLSLERARWILTGLEDDFVLVNIAGPMTYLRKGGQTVWTSRSITGLPFRKTPVFRDEIEYMEVNPTWTVPQSIFRKDKLPAIRKDRGYLDRGGYSVRRLSDGQTVPASSVNWGANNPGVTLVQRPGPDNALGLIKFMFPNDYAVYLHDTNDRTLFDRNERNLSSGCIRIENPFELANLLMADDPDWSPAQLDDILASGKTTRITLPEPMPVLLTYWTAWVEAGEVQFREDIYERDGAVLTALNADG